MEKSQTPIRNTVVLTLTSIKFGSLPITKFLESRLHVNLENTSWRQSYGIEKATAISLGFRLPRAHCSKMTLIIPSSHEILALSHQANIGFDDERCIIQQRFPRHTSRCLKLGCISFPSFAVFLSGRTLYLITGPYYKTAD